MRILAAADFHGKAHRYQSFQAGIPAEQPDVAVLAGDVNGSPSFFSLLETLDVPTLVVHGNMDSLAVGERIHAIDSAIFLHNQVYCHDGFAFVGVGGASPKTVEVTPVDDITPQQLDETACDVLVTHVPPKGVKDAAMLGRHIGSDWVRQFIEKRQPRVALCGHVHEDRGHAWLNEAMVVNCTIGKGGAYTVIDLDHDISVRHE
ncbi:MAG: metallophosphoesterase family protein [Candidatus Thermoplasmatota archaeon]|nr:metallophosphoesterase family protein [Candidatus Thermoplasmatota archaeon]